jgi:excisionase family DNA binding protein
MSSEAAVASPADELLSEITPTTPLDQLPAFVTVKQAARYIGIDASLIYSGIHCGEIPHRQFGKKLFLIPKSFLSEDLAVARPTPVKTPKNRRKPQRKNQQVVEAVQS